MAAAQAARPALLLSSLPKLAAEVLGVPLQAWSCPRRPPIRLPKVSAGLAGADAQGKQNITQ